MARQRITLENLRAWLRGAARDLEHVSHEAAISAAQGSRGIVVREINKAEPYPPVDTGTYRGAWQATRERYGASLWNDTPYAGDLEVGLPPHEVSIDVLMDWARRKLRAGRPRGKDPRGFTPKGPKLLATSFSEKRPARSSASVKLTSKASRDGFIRDMERRERNEVRAAKNAATNERIMQRYHERMGRHAERLGRFDEHEAEIGELASRAQRSLRKKGLAPRNILLNSMPGMERLFDLEIRRKTRTWAARQRLGIQKGSERSVSSGVSTYED